MQQGSNSSPCQMTSSHKLNLSSAQELFWQSLTPLKHALFSNRPAFPRLELPNPAPGHLAQQPPHRGGSSAANLRVFLDAVAILGILNEAQPLEFECVRISIKLK